MFAHRTRKTVLAGVSLLAAGMLTAACGPENGASAASAASGTSSADSGSPSAQSSSHGVNGGKASDPDGAHGAGTHGGGTHGGSTHGAGTSSSQGNAANAGDHGNKGYTGTVNGAMRYMAPGKFIVKPAKGGMPVAFYIEKNAKITGYGTLCGNPGQQTTCTERQLETTTRHRAVPASVTLDGGAASAITERKPGTAGGDAR